MNRIRSTAPGNAYPLGAHWDGEGVNFAIFSRHATRVELCLFDTPAATHESYSIPLVRTTHGIWHIYVRGIEPNQLYGYRVHGPYEPAAGHRFNANKVLIDPYARAVGREHCWSDSSFGYPLGHPQLDLAFDNRDNSATAPLGAVIDPRFSWDGDRHPRTPWQETVIYETHVRGQTMAHPGVSATRRGTYLGLASRSMITHFRRLGVTAVELLPVYYHVDERRLVEQGMVNYWGYNPLCFFAPHPRYARKGGTPGAVVMEFKQMVKRLHAAGIEVLLDVVYNHTGEGNQLGPTLSYRGLDNSSFYRLQKQQKHQYVDYSGCGNCPEIRNPVVLMLIADSLRYWVQEMHVDGFRFDLAPVLGREHHHFNPLASFFQIVHQDPVLSRVKMIAEPWDLGEGGYQVGGFRHPWREWNGKYRDTVRDFWRGERQAKGEFASRISGSNDLYRDQGRDIMSGINLVTCHDGFSLQDLVSYNQKHNEANGEENRDGENHNRSWNCGHEGPTDDPAINELRLRQRRNLLATLLLSAGVPMLRGGDELGKTQLGNNNAYCQDNPISWLAWSSDKSERKFMRYLRRLVRIRRRLLPMMLQAASKATNPSYVISWLRRDGQPMTIDDWNNGLLRFGVLLRPNGRPATSESALPTAAAVYFNGHEDPIVFQLPHIQSWHVWWTVLDTANPERFSHRCRHSRYTVEARSTCVFFAGPLSQLRVI